MNSGTEEGEKRIPLSSKKKKKERKKKDKKRKTKRQKKFLKEKKICHKRRHNSEIKIRKFDRYYNWWIEK